MPKFINYGSINIDYTYSLKHIARIGETIKTSDLKKFIGGKGLNQTVAITNNEIDIVHWGKINKNDTWLLHEIEKYNICTKNIEYSTSATGHAVIQIDKNAGNCIIIYQGANDDWDITALQNKILTCDAGDWFLTQNETPFAAEVLKLANEQNMITCWNPAPAPKKINKQTLALINYLIVNEIECEQYFGSINTETVQRKMLDINTNNNWHIILTLGKKGGYCITSNQITPYPAKKVASIDTTGSGDTFVGFFLASQFKQKNISQSLEIASIAAAQSTTIKGTTNSIPLLSDL